MAGIVTPDPLPKFPNGFPKAFIEEFSKRTGRKILCNLPYSGTQVIHDYGREQEETGALIVYTSADSVCQIAAHEDVIPVEQLYEYCKIARDADGRSRSRKSDCKTIHRNMAKLRTNDQTA